jgi:hypothetical protein
MKRVNLFGRSLMLIAMTLSLMFTGCKKDIDYPPIGPVDDGTLVDVAFSPTLNGETVPWNAKPNGSGKGDGSFTFSHRYAGHILRIISGNGAWSIDPGRWVADIPLLPQFANGTGTDAYSHKLPKGNYQARVLPVDMSAEAWTALNPTLHYATSNVPEEQIPFDEYYVENDAMDQTYEYASFESNNVPFAIISTAGQTVPLKMFTRQALMLLDLGNPDWQYDNAGVGEPLLQFVLDNSYLTGSSVAPHSLTYAELNAFDVQDGTQLQQVSEDVTNQQYFQYFVPGLKEQNNLPGVHMFDPIVKSTYLRFGNETAPTTMPAIWLRDYWNDGTLKANMVIRVKYSVGTLNFSTERLTWFGTGIDIVDGDIAVPEEPLTISIANTQPTPTDWTLEATVAGGTAPLTITWWKDAAATIPDTYNSIQVEGLIGAPLASGTHYAKVTDVHGHYTISNGMASPNHDMTSINFVNVDNVVTASSTGGYDLVAYTYAWYSDALMTNKIGSTASYNHGGIQGTYYCKVSDALGQSVSGSYAVVPTPFNASINTNGFSNMDGTANLTIDVNSTTPPVGTTYAWTLTNIQGSNISTPTAYIDGSSTSRNVTVRNAAGQYTADGTWSITCVVTNGTQTSTVTFVKPTHN